MALEITLQPMTAIEAVNIMLASIGQGAINSLESSESIDAESAKTALINASRAVQTRGWWFNREYDFPLTPDAGTGEIALPANYLQFSPNVDWRHLVDRGGKLYDTQNRTYVYASGTEVKASLILLFEFETLPQAARNYITYQAGRHFQASGIGSDLLYKFTREMEADALAELTRAELRATRPNAITDNAQTYRIARHRRGY